MKQICGAEIGLVARQRKRCAVGLVFEVARGIERQQHRHRTASDTGKQARIDRVQLHQRGRRAWIRCRHAPLAGERKSGSDRRAAADLGAELIDNGPPFDADGWEIAADEQRALAHPGDSKPATRLIEGVAARRRRRPGARASRRRGATHPHVLGSRMADGVRERLLGDPVDDQLRVAGQVSELAGRPRSSSRGSPGRSSSRTWPASAALSPRSSSAVGRSWRASVSSSCIARLASPRISASSAASSGGAFSRAASSRSRRPVSDWLTSSWRSRAMRARSSS